MVYVTVQKKTLLCCHRIYSLPAWIIQMFIIMTMSSYLFIHNNMFFQ